jgi:hypothetical protein
MSQTTYKVWLCRSEGCPDYGTSGRARCSDLAHQEPEVFVAESLKAEWQEQARNALLDEIDATLKEWAQSYGPGTYEREIYRRAAAVIAGLYKTKRT